jgi:hypothetical protein
LTLHPKLLYHAAVLYIFPAVIPKEKGEGGGRMNRRRKERKAARQANQREQSRLMAEEGRSMQLRVFRVIKEMIGETVGGGYRIIDAHCYPFNSVEDRKGKDLALVIRGPEDGPESSVIIPFGVSISHRSVLRSNRRHPNVPTIWFPLNITDEQIKRRIRYIVERYGPEAGGD